MAEGNPAKKKHRHADRVHDALAAMSKRVRGKEWKGRRALFKKAVAREARIARRAAKRLAKSNPPAVVLPPPEGTHPSA